MSNRPFLSPTTSDQRSFNRAAAHAINSLLLPEAVFLKPVALPSNPVKGQTIYDSADDTVKTWNGTVWKALY